MGRSIGGVSDTRVHRGTTWLLPITAWQYPIAYLILTLQWRHMGGHWPMSDLSQSNPSYVVHAQTMRCLAVPFFYGLPLWIGLLMIPGFRLSQRAHAMQLLLWAAGGLAFWISVSCVSSPFMDWVYL